MATKKKAPAKRKPKAKVTKPIVVDEVKAEETDGLDVKAEREALFNSWKRLVKIANTLLTQAEDDPLSVKASMMAQIVRVLSQSGKILDDYEKHLRKVDEEPDIDPDTGEEVITPEEQAMMDEFNRMQNMTDEERIAEIKRDLAETPVKKDDGSEFTDIDLSDGLNFRR